MNKKSSALRQHLVNKGVDPEACKEFRLFSCGPIFPEADDVTKHKEKRDIVAAMEKALSEAISDADYDVLNVVHCRKKLDEDLFSEVMSEFQKCFPRLGRRL